MAKSILLVGLDVTGQSIGLALKQSGVEAEVVGYDPDGKLATEAKRKGAIDRAENRISAAQDSPLIVLSVAAPLQAETLKSLASWLKTDTVVLDASPLKQPGLEALDDLRRAGAHYLGILPAVGGTRLDASEIGRPEVSADRFQGGVLGLVIPPDTPQEALDLALQLSALLGATPYFLEAGEANSSTAVTHILPPLISTALMQIALRETAWREVRRTAGPDFTEMVGLGLRHPPGELARTALLARTTTIEKLDHLVEALQDLRGAMAREDGDALTELISQSDTSLQAWLAARRQANWALEEVGPTAPLPRQSAFGRLFGFRGPGRSAKPQS